jgi:hypothetical protein
VLLLSFSLDEKKTIPQSGTRQKNASTHIPKAFGTGLARFFAGPTHIVNGKLILKLSTCFNK